MADVGTAEHKEKVLEVFRCYDLDSNGTVPYDKLKEALRLVDSSVFAEGNLEQLLEASGAATESGVVRYEDFLAWVMANVASRDSAVAAVEPNPICQAAFDGDVDALRALVDKDGKAALACSGFVALGGEPMGLWHAGLGINSIQLKRFKEDPTLVPANALHYAAFAGKAAVVRFLIAECGMNKEEEGQFGLSPLEIASCHRLFLDGAVLEDDGETLDYLAHGEDEPLDDQELARSITLRKFRPQAEA